MHACHPSSSVSLNTVQIVTSVSHGKPVQTQIRSKFGTRIVCCVRKSGARQQQVLDKRQSMKSDSNHAMPKLTASPTIFQISPFYWMMKKGKQYRLTG
jgi:hypothetical protein